MKFTIESIKGQHGNYHFKYMPWKLAVDVIFTDDNNRKWQLAVACETSYYTKQVAKEIEEIFPLLTSFKDISQLYKECIIYKEVLSIEGRKFTIVYNNIDPDHEQTIKNKIFINKEF